LKRINKLEEKTIATTESWKIDDAESWAPKECYMGVSKIR
jgi:hypothetical protein